MISIDEALKRLKTKRKSKECDNDFKEALEVAITSLEYQQLRAEEYKHEIDSFFKD